MPEHDQAVKPPEGTLKWLLEKDNPPIRYLTLTKLLGRPEKSAEVKKARSHLMDYEVTQGILKHHKQFWQDDDRSY